MAQERVNWLAIVGFWLLLAVVLVIKANLQAGTVPLFSDTDDAMRMVTATDLLDGQRWQDNIQYRDNAPFGSPMHWSRLPDAPLAGLIVVLTPLMGAAAPNAAAMLWPVIELLPLLLGSVLLTIRFTGPGGALAGAVLPVLALPVFNEFLPGRVGHHGLQILLTLGLVYCTLAGRKRLAGAILAGVLAATSLAIGIETIATVIVAIGIFGLYWVADPMLSRRPALGFALALPAATLLHFLAATPPALYLTIACDALSFTYVIAAVAAGAAIGIAALTGNRLPLWWQRLALLGTLGVLALAMTLRASPVCIGGPYAQVDPVLANAFFPLVMEAQNVMVRLAASPVLTLSYVSSAIVGLSVALWLSVRMRGEQRIEWLVLAAYLAAGVAVTCIQIRGSRFSVALAVPAGAWLILELRRRYLQGRGHWRAWALLGAWMAFAGGLQLAVGASVAAAFHSDSSGVAQTLGAGLGLADPTSARALCFGAENFAALAALPAASLMAPMDLGAPILHFTHHAVTGAGYHRNGQGMMDVIRFFNADQSVAEAIARARGLKYLVLCQRLHETYGYAGATSASFSKTYDAGGHWSWLTPISDPAAPLQILRIDLPR